MANYAECKDQEGSNEDVNGRQRTRISAHHSVENRRIVVLSWLAVNYPSKWLVVMGIIVRNPRVSRYCLSESLRASERGLVSSEGA